MKSIFVNDYYFDFSAQVFDHILSYVHDKSWEIQPGQVATPLAMYCEALAAEDTEFGGAVR